jgi:hypothetical protein
VQLTFGDLENVTTCPASTTITQRMERYDAAEFTIGEFYTIEQILGI